MPRPLVPGPGALHRASLALGLALGLSACSPESGAPPAAPATAVVPVTAPAAPSPRDTGMLMADAERALAENRLHSPAGDNAVEAYLALRGRAEGPRSTIETALLDLSPYVVNGVEQATADRNWDEATRRLALLRQIDAEAPALARLQGSLDAARQAEQAQAEAASRDAAVAAARAAVEPVRPAPALAVAGPPPAPPRPTALVPADAAPVAAPSAVSPAVPAAAPATERRIVAQPSPRFPEQALRRRLEGSVDLRLRIAPDGRVLDAAVVASSHAVFEREAVLAARRWRYTPAETASDVRVAVAFRLPERS